MNVLFGARQLGYEAKPITSYRYILKIIPRYDESKTIINQNGEEVVYMTSVQANFSNSEL